MLGDQDKEQYKPVSGPLSGEQGGVDLPQADTSDCAVDSQWSSSSQSGEAAAALTAEEKAAVAALLFRKGLLQAEGASFGSQSSLGCKTGGGKRDDGDAT